MASVKAARKIPASVVCYGDSRPSPRPLPLRAGPLRLSWEEGTLRGIFLGTRELVKQIYVAVRDPSWLTVPGTISGLRMQRNKDSFLIRFRSNHRLKPMHFVWDARIEGSSDGSILFDMSGIARSTFERARIGICVLHPVQTCAGKPCEVLHGEDGQAYLVQFPLAVDSNAAARGFHSMRGMEHEALPGLSIRFRFEGDLFEMEDQRNWTDASFKTFSTPLHLPVPVRVERGTRVEQSLSLELIGAAAREPAAVDRSPSTTLTLARRSSGKLPLIGFGAASDLEPLSAQELRRLSQLGPSHLRVDLNLAETELQQRLNVAARDARRLGCSLEIALLNHEEQLADALKDITVPVSTWLLYPDSVALAQEIRRHFPGARIAAGTNANFFAFNESPPAGRHIDMATFAIHPQTHATDNTSLVETLAIQGELVAQARQMSGLPVVVSPVTLKPRFNPDATGPEPPLAPGELPSQVDPRQMSLFGAGWTLGSLKYLAEAGAASVTFYETTGWRGLMERVEGSPLPRLFRSIPGSVYPMFHVFAWLASFRGGSIVPLTSDGPLQVAGLAVRHRGRTRMIVANLTGTVQDIQLRCVRGKARVQILDETNGIDAISRPEAFARQQGRLQRVEGLSLPRYSLVRLDPVDND